jgi:formate-dependent nitrite reductase membrane component NrfD
VPLYLFAGGLAAGMFIVAAIADLLGVRSRKALATSRIVAYGVIPILALAGIFLTAHLGKPERGLGFPLFFTNYNSWMTRGGWIIGATAPLMLLYAALWFFRVFPGLRRVLGVIGIPLSILLAVYTGFLLSGAGYVPLWSHDYLPALFLNSGLNSGIAAAGLLALLFWRRLGPVDTDPRGVIRWLGIALAVLVVLEGWELYGFMRDLRSQGLLMGHERTATNDRFQYKVEAGGELEPGAYVAVVTWVNNATGAEEGMSSDTPIRVAEAKRQITIITPRRLGVTYNVYLGPSRAQAQQVAANLGPRESATIREISAGGLSLPLNIQTGGRFLAPSGGQVAYRYLTGGAGYPRALFGGTAEAAEPVTVGISSTPTVFHTRPHSGNLAGWFWWGVVGLALVLPIALTLIEFVSELGGSRIANGVAAVKFASVIVGALLLRFVMVWGGDIKAPLVFPSNWPLPLPPPGLGG